MAIEHLGPADRFAAGAAGMPGRRRFYLEVDTVTEHQHLFLAEKEQVANLAAQGLLLLRASGVEPDPVVVRQIIADGLEIDDTDDPRFRVSSISLALSDDNFTITLESAEGNDAVAFEVGPEQFQAMAVIALQVVAAGRPTCPRCALPMDPEGHDCPSVNGHRTR